MRKFLLSLLCMFISLFYLNAQTLYSTTFYGGTNGGGTIGKFIPPTNDLVVSESFDNYAANPYYTNLIQASDGKYYGMTFNGGKNGDGIIFSFDAASNTFIKLKDFDNANGDGASPTGSFVQANNGLLYATTSFGGVYGLGVIFSFNPSNNIYTKLYDFDNSTGANPQGNLIQATDGKLYGEANGGDNGFGVIFSFDPSLSTFTKLYEFDNINGASPEGSLVQATDGKLYGVTVNGGVASYGVIFSFDIHDSSFTKLKDFDDLKGGYSYSNLIQATDGKLYGMTFGGGGMYGFIFDFDPVTSNYSIVKDFDSSSGGNPYGGLIQANDGKLYGMTSDGGSNNIGVIFSYNPVDSVYTTLKNFDDNSGSSPFGSLFQGNDGKLYGMTFQGGNSDDGVIFSYDKSNSTYQKLKDFGTNESGRNSSASLLKAADKKLYGMTFQGGSNNGGVIFSYDPSINKYVKLKDFDSTDGINPYGSLIQANDGKLYGMTSAGGINNDGVIFSFDPITFEYKKLKDFDYTDGANPYGSLIQANDGKLYGMTLNGGDLGYGVIFSFTPTTGVYAKINFDYDNGAYPYGNLIQATDGKLYGMTSNGGNGYVVRYGYRIGAGVIFSLDLSSFTYKSLRDFDYYNDGGFSYGSFLQRTDGKLYGMTARGGGNDAGVIFSYEPSSSSFLTLTNFDNGTGGKPCGNLMQASDGKLYGTTSQGASNNYGSIFSLDTLLFTYTVLSDYNGANGANSYIGSAFVEVPESAPLPVTLVNFGGKFNGSANHLSWKVTNQTDIKYYELQRSIDRQNFTTISEIKAGNNNDYSFNDYINTSVTSAYYYRLKSVDNTGNFTYSSLLKLSRIISKNAIVVYPNPFKGNLVAKLNLMSADKVIFILTDVNGQLLYTANKSLHQGTNVVSIDETNSLAKGSYFLTIITSLQSQTTKVIKEN